jgi:predicted peroxiredoxin
MEKIVNKLINDAVVGADRYANNGSTWLIFTETKQWVIELTEEKTLWYNYNFFKNLFSYLSFDVVENQHYITKWVEDTIINGVKGTNVKAQPRKLLVEDTIQNGVKHTPNISLQLVKGYGVVNQVENTIKNGVKETKGINGVHGMNVAIQNGVKETKLGAPDNRDYFIEDAIQNGVKHTEPGGYLGSIEMKGKIVHQLESPKQNEEVEYVIENGVKHTVCSSAPFVYGVKDTLQHGVKETFDETHHRRREVVLTIRDGIKETYDDAYHHKSRVDGVIKNGIKQTCAQIPSIQPVVERILEEGIIQDSQDC